MTSTETRPSTRPRFPLNENASQPASPGSERFLIRPENPSARTQALQEFDAEVPSVKVQRPAHVTRPGVSELLLNAETLLQAGEIRTAIHLIRQALCLDSRHPEALRKMLRCLGDRDWEQSQRLAILKTLSAVEPTFENFARLGMMLIDVGQPDAALDTFFEGILRVEDENELLFDVHKNMGNIFVRRGDFEAAEEAYHKAFALNPDSDVLQVNLGTLAVQREDWGSAMEKFRRSLEINPANDKGWVGVALCHHQVGDSVLALATLENALDLSAGNRTAVHLMAKWALSTGFLDKAILRLQDYLTTQDADVDMSLLLIHLFCQQQKYSEARLEVERALCWAPDRTDLAELKEQLDRELAQVRKVLA